MEPEVDGDQTEKPSSLRKLIRRISRKDLPRQACSSPTIFDRLNQTYQLEGKNKALLHGHLHIQILNAQNLRNRDCNCLLSPNSCGITEDVSDPYVTVHAGPDRLLKTRWIMDNLNPEWNEDFFVPVAHYVDGIIFKVKDQDFKLYAQMLGEVVVPVTELIRYNDDGKPLRVGIHKVAWLDKKAHHGSLEFFIDYVPIQLMRQNGETGSSLPMEVPGVYFEANEGNRVKYYVNAEDGSQYGAPVVTYGGKDDNKYIWEPQRLWKDTYDAICQAKHVIYCTGWALDVTQSLLRGQDKEEALQKGKYSPYFGELFKQKAEEGVDVLLLIWDDATSNAVLPGMMGTHDEQARIFFRGTKVKFRLCPMSGDQTNAAHQKAGKWVMFTHHQKTVIVDSPRQERFARGRELLAFTGGIDLTDGRWDTRTHPLFRSLKTDHNGDCHNACFNVDAASAGPREPWHDIHCSVRGPATMDIVKNFTERWKMQCPNETNDLVDLDALHLADPPHHEGDDAWCTQLFRSIDERTALFDDDKLAPLVQPTELNSLEGVRLKPVLKKTNSFLRLKHMLRGRDTRVESHREFTAPDASTFHFTRSLRLKKGRRIDDSVHSGILYHIRQAQHTVYIESQYFLSSAHFWPSNKTTKCGNLIASELTLKICEKIEAGERFCAYVLIPMWPEGLADSQAVQAILRFQTLSMNGMYKRIAASLKRRRERESKDQDQEHEAPNVSPRDYLSFYCLVNRETKEGDQSSKTPSFKTDEPVLAKSRRHPIYVHSKMVIVDDAIAMIGSANINQRSLDGARDSEIVLGSWQPAHLATAESIPYGHVHGFRLHCWSTITGQMEDVFREPSSLACIRRLNEIAEENWKKFTGKEVQEMDSHLVPYPIVVEADGSVKPRQENNCFPDTKGKIVGTETSVLPEFLTT
jgi:phospholipase D1/2